MDGLVNYSDSDSDETAPPPSTPSPLAKRVKIDEKETNLLIDLTLISQLTAQLVNSESWLMTADAWTRLCELCEVDESKLNVP